MQLSNLTQRQRQVLELIQRHITQHGAPPTIRELREGLRLKSLRGVTVHLDALVRKGVIERSRQARGIRLLVRGKMPDSREDISYREDFSLRTISVPVVGRIAAGQPILAE